jgi:hypothetical protein
LVHWFFEISKHGKKKIKFSHVLNFKNQFTKIIEFPIFYSLFLLNRFGCKLYIIELIQTIHKWIENFYTKLYYIIDTYIYLYQPPIHLYYNKRRRVMYGVQTPALHIICNIPTNKAKFTGITKGLVNECLLQWRSQTKKFVVAAIKIIN